MQIPADMISHHVDRGSSPAVAAKTVRAALNGSINSVAEDRLTDQGMSCATVFGGTGFVGRRLVRLLRDCGIRVRAISRHRGLSEDAGIEQIVADAHDQRSIEAAVAGADGVVNAISLYVEHGSDTFHSVHVETAAKIARAARQAGIRRFVHVSGIGANTASSSLYIRSRGEGEAAVQTVFPGAVIIRPAVMFASDDAFLTTISPAAAVHASLSDIRRRQDEAPTGLRERRGSGDHTNFAAGPETVSYLRTSWSTGLLVRGVVANHCAYRRIAASVDAPAICLLERIGRRCRDAAAAAIHPQSSRTYEDRHHGIQKPARVSRAWNFAAIT